MCLRKWSHIFPNFRPIERYRRLLECVVSRGEDSFYWATYSAWLQSMLLRLNDNPSAPYAVPLPRSSLQHQPPVSKIFSSTNRLNPRLALVSPVDADGEGPLNEASSLAYFRTGRRQLSRSPPAWLSGGGAILPSSSHLAACLGSRPLETAEQARAHGFGAASVDTTKLALLKSKIRLGRNKAE